MKRLVAAMMMAAALLAGSTAWADWVYVPGAPVAAPVVAYYAPAYVAVPPAVIAIRRYPVPAAVALPARVVVRSPVVVSGPVIVPAPTVYPYPAPVVIRAKVYYPGQPVRNAVRAVLP